MSVVRLGQFTLRSSSGLVEEVAKTRSFGVGPCDRPCDHRPRIDRFASSDGRIGPRRIRPMHGLMQHEQLTLTTILERAEKLHPQRRIVTRVADGSHAETYAELGARVRRLASALREMGVGPGDRVATFAGNSWRHLELYFAVPCMGAVLHTLNPRLHHDQIAVDRPARRRATGVRGRRAGGGVRPGRGAVRPCSRSCGTTTSGEPARRARLRDAARCRRRRTSPGPSSTSTTRASSATRRGPRASRRASCTRTARWCCTR